MQMQIEEKAKILEVLESHQLGVISTVSEQNKPEAALVGFAVLPETLEIIFGTFETFRKYKNLQSNKNAAFVIGWDNKKTVQVEGEAKELVGEEMQSMMEIYVKKFPSSKKYLDNSEEKFFKIIPSWMRFRNLDEHPEEMFEINFEDKTL
jgi:general stress protein 26